MLKRCLLWVLLAEVSAAGIAVGCSSSKDGAPGDGVAAGDASDEGAPAAPRSDSGQDGAPAEASGGALADALRPEGSAGPPSGLGSDQPTITDGGLLATAVSAGTSEACAVTSSGALYCWGIDGVGQLGDGRTSNSAFPVPVAGLSSGVTAVSVGVDVICAIVDGGVECWGFALTSVPDAAEFLGAPYVTTPVPIDGLSSGVASVSAGGGFACALTTGGAVECWGDNTGGKLGDGTTTSHLAPAPVSGLSSGVIAIAAGRDFACALTDAGAVQCWGDNGYGALGGATDAGTSALPVTIAGLESGVVAVSVGTDTGCAVLTGGDVKCWGDNAQGSLGNGTTTRSPLVQVTGLTSSATAVSVGTTDYFSSVCALVSGGRVLCWGSGYYASPEADGATPGLVPAPVDGVPNAVTTVSVGNDFTCVVSVVGGVACWGANDSGQLGDGTFDASATAVPVRGFGGVPLVLPIPDAGSDAPVCASFGADGPGVQSGALANAAAPNAAGGTIGGGTYYETSLAAYGACLGTSTATDPPSTLVLSPTSSTSGTFETASLSVQGRLTTSSGTYSTNGTTLTVTTACPPPIGDAAVTSESIGYTATGSTIQLVSAIPNIEGVDGGACQGSVVETFVKQ